MEKGPVNGLNTAFFDWTFYISPCKFYRFEEKTDKRELTFSAIVLL